MCLAWYWDILPETHYVAVRPASLSAYNGPQRSGLAQIVVTVRGHRLPAPATMAAESQATDDQASEELGAVENAPELTGHVLLFDPQGVLSADSSPVGSQEFSVSDENPLAVIIERLAAGEYAVLVYFDLNANEQLDFNPAGRPIEPFLMSRKGGAPPTLPLDLESAGVTIAPFKTNLIEFDFRARKREP
jgi:uncharacterized protein (DUF2141 family)